MAAARSTLPEAPTSATKPQSATDVATARATCHGKRRGWGHPRVISHPRDAATSETFHPEIATMWAAPVALNAARTDEGTPVRSPSRMPVARDASGSGIHASIGEASRRRSDAKSSGLGVGVPVSRRWISRATNDVRVVDPGIASMTLPVDRAIVSGACIVALPSATSHAPVVRAIASTRTGTIRRAPRHSGSLITTPRIPTTPMVTGDVGPVSRTATVPRSAPALAARSVSPIATIGPVRARQVTAAPANAITNADATAMPLVTRSPSDVASMPHVSQSEASSAAGTPRITRLALRPTLGPPWS